MADISQTVAEPQVSVKVSRILALRDAIATEDYDEAWHQLSQMANDEQPESDPFNPWKHLERML